jgi:hypothetical protein
MEPNGAADRSQGLTLVDTLHLFIQNIEPLGPLVLLLFDEQADGPEGYKEATVRATAGFKLVESTAYGPSAPIAKVRCCFEWNRWLGGDPALELDESLKVAIGVHRP